MDSKQNKALKYDKAEERKANRIGISYKWIALSNTTLGAMMATIDGSILIISLPAIFNGLGINALASSNSDLLLWLLMGYIIVSAVTVVTIGRLSDMFGRVKLYNIGFLIFAIASTLLCVSSYLISGTPGLISLIILRLFQGLGGGFLIGNSAAIITDAFPNNERGKAMGINQIAAIAGGLLGMLVGGVLAAIDWHLIFLISVPVGIVGTIWSYLALHEIATIRERQRLDVFGNITFATSVALIVLSLTFAILPYGGNSTGFTNPIVDLGLVSGAALFASFLLIESRVKDPMIFLPLFKIRAFAASCLSMLLAGIARGGLQFMLIIWLQGIWLPLHGISFENTPLKAAIAMLPLTVGFLVVGPLAGYLSDKYGARRFTTVGMLINCVSFLLLATLPANFNYLYFGILLFVLGIGQGLFGAPNTAALMNSVPPDYRGVASGIRATLLNLSQVLSIAIFFSILVVGVGGPLPNALYKGLVAQNVANATALQISSLPPTTALLAAELGANPMKALIPSNILETLPPGDANTITGTDFFPTLISTPFLTGIRYVFYLAAIMTFIAAICSALRGKGDIYEGGATS